MHTGVALKFLILPCTCHFIYGQKTIITYKNLT
jgi:hypothetical protein